MKLPIKTFLQYRAAPVLILALGIPILQWHAIAFWSGAVGNLTGWAWPVLLEVISLWLWSFRRLNLAVLGLFATIILLAGPLHQVGSPIIRELEITVREHHIHRTQASDLREEISSLEKSLGTYRDNSETRLGWYDLITGTEQRLSTARLELKEAVRGSSRVGDRMPWQTWATVILQLCAVAMFQTLNILSIITLVQPTSQTPSQSQQGIAPVQPEGTISPSTIRLLQEEVRRRIKSEASSTNEWCRNNMNKRYLWMLLNHFKHIQEEKDVHTNAKLAEFAEEYLEGNTPPEE